MKKQLTHPKSPVVCNYPPLRNQSHGWISLEILFAWLGIFWQGWFHHVCWRQNGRHFPAEIWSVHDCGILKKPAFQSWLQLYTCLIRFISVICHYWIWVLTRFCVSQSSQASLLAKCKSISSSCTGVYTVECGAAVVQKVVEESNLVQFPVTYECKRCFETCQWLMVCVQLCNGLSKSSLYAMMSWLIFHWGSSDGLLRFLWDSNE